jgi:arginine:pyruvate transaminase
LEASSGGLIAPRLSSLAGRIEAVTTGGSWRVHRLARERVAAGHDVIVLSLGEPDFPPPEPAVEAAIAGLRGGRTRYTYARGEPAALEAIARRASQQAGHSVATDRVVFFPGSQAALFATMLCLAGAEDEVILGEPAYATYPGVLAAAGATPVEVPLRPEDGFRARIDDVAAAVTARTRAILVNSPHNPSGAVATRAELDGLAALCREHGLWLVADEAYASLVWARPHTSVLALDGAEDFAISLGSLSKSHAMTGFRFGWAVAPAELAARLERLLESMLFGSPAFVQDAGVAALADEGASLAMRDAYERRARIFCETLAGVPGVVARFPEGGMFVFVDVRGTDLTGDDFALRLLEDEDVAVTPGRRLRAERRRPRPRQPRGGGRDPRRGGTAARAAGEVPGPVTEPPG